MTTSTLRILVCDHRGVGVEARFEARQEEYELRVTRSVRESLRSLAEWPPHLVVLDPLTRGIATELSLLAQADDRGEESIPFLVIWDRDEERTARKLSEQLGPRAWDLVHRDAPSEEFGVRLRQLVSSGRMVREMGQLRHRAAHDDRTELLRPQAFQSRLDEHFAAARRHKLELCFVMMDLDRFGQINKRHDHTVGDRLIARVGGVIRTSLRTEDVAGRLGGDEFAVLLPYTKKVDAVPVVNRLRERIQALSGPFEGADEDIPVSTSIGFETFDGSDLDSAEALRRNAEKALRKAKTSGGDRAIYYRSLEGDEQP